MAFGIGRPKKPAKVIEPEEDEEEDREKDNGDYSVEEESLNEELDKKNLEIKRLKQESKTVKPSARIISGKIVGEGIYEFTLVTNKSLGQIGEEFEI